MVCVLPEMPAEIRDLIVSPQLSDILERTPESGPNILNTFPNNDHCFGGREMTEIQKLQVKAEAMISFY